MIESGQNEPASKYSGYPALRSALEVRISHAEQRGAELARQIQTWLRDSGPRAVGRIADDRLSWELRLFFPQEPALTSWGLILGDAVGSLRATLNNLLWGVADVEQLVLAKPKRLQFPIAGTAGEWNNQSSWVEELPEAVRQAVSEVQPHLRGDDATSDLLLLLKDLSNSDRHHLALAPLINPQELGRSFAVEFPSEEAAGANAPPLVELGGEIKDNGLLLRQTTKDPIVRVRGHYNVNAQVQVSTAHGKIIGATECVALLCHYVRQVVDHILAERS